MRTPCTTPSRSRPRKPGQSATRFVDDDGSLAVATTSLFADAVGAARRVVVVGTFIGAAGGDAAAAAAGSVRAAAGGASLAAGAGGGGVAATGFSSSVWRA